MFPRLVALIALLSIAFSAAGVAQESSPTLSVRIAKTRYAVKPFGTADGGSGRVAVRLSKYYKDGDRRLLSRTRVPVADDGSYRARFRRPRRGSCRVVVRYAGVRDAENFPCYIPNFPRGSARITALADDLEIRLLIAENDRQRGYGLMYRPRLATDLGVAFLWESDASGGFWMKNTLIPLSIAFFDWDEATGSYVILRIMDMEPCTEDPCPIYDPGVTYRGALEVNQGSFDDWGVSEGDRITISR